MDLSATHGPDYLVLSARTRREFLSAIQETLKLDFSNPAERRSITQLAMKLSQVWGKATSFCMNFLHEQKLDEILITILVFYCFFNFQLKLK